MRHFIQSFGQLKSQNTTLHFYYDFFSSIFNVFNFNFIGWKISAFRLFCSETNNPNITPSLAQTGLYFWNAQSGHLHTDC